MSGLTVLKLGGSVITVKDDPETVDEAALAEAAEAIGTALAEGTVQDLIVVHGGGSFGHHHADRHGVTVDSGSHDADALAEIHRAMGALNDAVVSELQSAGVPALPVRPLSVAHRGADGELAFPSGAVGTMTDEGFVPVVHGDVIAHAGAGGTVLSGDEAVVALAESLGAQRVGLCSAVPGVLDESGAVIDRIDSIDAVAEALGESEATDVTGGMAGKVRALLALEAPAAVFGADALAAFLAGERPGTEIRGG